MVTNRISGALQQNAPNGVENNAGNNNEERRPTARWNARSIVFVVAAGGYSLYGFSKAAYYYFNVSDQYVDPELGLEGRAIHIKRGLLHGVNGLSTMLVALRYLTR